MSATNLPSYDRGGETKQTHTNCVVTTHNKATPTQYVTTDRLIHSQQIGFQRFVDRGSRGPTCLPVCDCVCGGGPCHVGDFFFVVVAVDTNLLRFSVKAALQWIAPSKPRTGRGPLMPLTA